MHFSFALGMAIAPLIEEPFLSPDHNATETHGNAPSDEIFTNGTHTTEDSRIIVPYTIGSLSLVAAAALFLILYYKVPYTDPKRTVTDTKQKSIYNNNNNNTSKQTRSPSSVSSSSRSQLIDTNEEKTDSIYYMRLIVLSCFLLCFYTGVELSTMNFLPEFVTVIALKLTKSKAAYMSSVMSAAFAVNRLLSIVVAAKFRTKTMLYVSFLMICTGNGILLFFANSSEVMLWIAVVIIGAGHSSVYPCLMSFLEERINVTTFVCGLFMFCSGASSVAVPILLGYYVEKYPLIYVYINVCGLAICLLIFAILYVIDRKYRKAKRNAMYQSMIDVN